MKNSACLSTSIAGLTMTGAWVPKEWSTGTRKIIYFVYAVLFQVCLFFSTVLAEMAYLIVIFGNTNKVVESTVLLLSHLVQIIKFCTIWLRQGRVKELVSWIDGPNFTHNGPNQKQILEETVKMAKYVGLLMICSALVTGLFWNIVPLLRNEITLPLNTAYPFVLKGNLFVIMYIYLAVAVVLVGIGDASCNFVVSALLTMAAVQLDVLCYNLKDIKATNQKESYDKTVSCIKHHQNIIAFVDQVDSVFNVSIISQYLVSSVVLCMTVFKISITTEPIEMITMVFYLICVFMELLMYSYPGDLLLNKSLKVSEAVYECDWVNCSLKTKRLLLLMTLRAQRPLMLKAGGIYNVSLPTAAMVVQTSYSYYAMLKQTH